MRKKSIKSVKKLKIVERTFRKNKQQHNIQKEQKELRKTAEMEIKRKLEENTKREHQKRGENKRKGHKKRNKK